MNRPALWLAALVSIAAVALMGSAADAQPKPITSCGTTVSAAGSYILNGNLTSTSTTSPCINVTANEVTIDLNGFVISGNGGTSTGISSSGTKLAVTDGTITGFGVGIYDPSAGSRISHLTVMNSAKDEHYGIYLGDSARVSDSILLNNGSDGIGVGANAVVTHCIFGGNGGYGLYAYSTGAVATENSAGANSEGGVDTSGKATVEGNAGTNNPSFNFADSGGATYDTNAAAGSSSAGFRCGSSFMSGKILGSCVLVGNVAYGNRVFGFVDAGGSTFRANTADSNGVDGFFAEEGLGFNGNTADDNQVGFVVGCPINLLGNTAENNTSSPITYSAPGCGVHNNLGF
ncbi:MAG TPA: hypothetical protein VGY99_24710 [Candidatus Binataceae bacterium]|jgi:hypothetical protein|nr:hypothetical protein [Candidatus Binataceae bacterium]